ncbi:MAG TPA: hypothetical protein VGS09_10345 [Actinomycetota bacterium]|nr:hypothetical protein [Actinomycetota bacterium]
MRNWLYRLARTMGDYSAIRRGRVGLWKAATIRVWARREWWGSPWRASGR